MVSILGMASNRGRNLLNIHRSSPDGAELGLVLSNKGDAPILDAAADLDVPVEAVERQSQESRVEHERRILDTVADYSIDLVCLDGYMRILSNVFLDAMPTTLNVHPSLLPAFPGMDAWGDALDAGVAVSGCTVHVVTDATDDAGNVIEDEIDSGPIVTQVPIPVVEGDTRESLKDRILYQGEFSAYPRAVRWISTGDVEVTRTADGVEVQRSEEVIEAFPPFRIETNERHATLRYGENPHQAAALYLDRSCEEPNVVGAPQVGGEKGMSYVNYVDAAGALDLIVEFEDPAAAVIKHANPAGCASAGRLVDAYESALATDPMSAFGGVVALNRPCDVPTAERIVDSVKHVVVAPGFEDGALDTLGKREDMRVLDVSTGIPQPIGPESRTESLVRRPIVGGVLVQERDLFQPQPDDLEVVTERKPSDEERDTMCFAWRVVKHATSNAIVLADGTETVGLGIGQVSRVDAVRLATMKASEHAEGKDPAGSVMASDAFFPFPDGIEAAADAGVSAVVQPGGSIRDDQVIEAADAHDMAMALTGTRAFKHE